MVGIGKFQVLGKYSEKTIDDAADDDDKLKTTEVNFNYIIKSFNARVGFYYLNQKDDIAEHFAERIRHQTAIANVSNQTGDHDDELRRKL